MIDAAGSVEASAPIISGRSSRGTVWVVAGLRLDSAARPMISQSTCSRLRGFGCPVKWKRVEGGSQFDGQGLRDRMLPAGMHEAKQVRVLFVQGRVAGPPQPQDGCDRLIGETGEARELPAEEVGSKPQGGQGVADVVVAVAKRAFAVFPGLPPENAGQPRQKPFAAEMRDRRPPKLAGQLGAAFQSVLQRRVMVDAGATPLNVRQYQVGFGGVQVAAGWVHAQRPA